MSAQRPIEIVRQTLADLLGGADASIAHRRAQAAVFAASQPQPPSGLTIAAEAWAAVPVERLQPPDGPLILLHFHGGGYVMGDPAGSRGLTTRLAMEVPATVLSVDYRLAPEHPFPAAEADALSAYAAVLDAGADPRHIAFAGESAGGGLAVATLIGARKAGLPMPAACVALSPWIDLACTGASHRACAGRDPLLTRDILLEMAALYLGRATPSPDRTCLAQADLSGLPPMLIQVGSEEVLLDDARALAAAAQAQGVTVELEVWPEMIHVWQMFGAALPEAEAALQKICAFLAAALSAEAG